MGMGKFYVGDRVKAVVDNPDGNEDIHTGSLGTVCHVPDWPSGRIGVRWDYPVHRGHDCNSSCQKGYGWYVDKNEILVYEEEEEATDIDDHSFMCIIGEA